MCLTVPRQIEEIQDNKARLQDGRWVLLHMIEEPLEVGDMVLAQANMAVERVSKETVAEMKKVMGEE